MHVFLQLLFLSLPGLSRQSISFSKKMDHPNSGSPEFGILKCASRIYSACVVKPAGDDECFRLCPFPYFAGELYEHAQLRPLLLLGKDIAFFGGGEAALRRETQLLNGDIFRRLINASLDFVLALQGSGLRCYKAKDDDLFAFRQEAQRLESAGTVAVVFKKI